ncbi:hypothetical protein phi1422_0054 [Bdellovibrio phage phi1422]|uniref:hypothetical protein n=1 Tax=Bdellovibrio phage phi1422 TaxID=1127515 RepID=UPI0002536D6A|nr:hypothetical protein F395_gp54 [Bdellovibrio phage phi1422]AFC22574.1 hypothetical protein phi1422_0054 [Bdellovibrio phage phi1422]
MVIRALYKRIGFNVPVPFGVFGGLAPYTFSVEPGGAGGSIDANGIYTSGFKKGRDTVKVVDSLGETATAEISVLPALYLLADIVQEYLALPQDQVTIFNQKSIPVSDEKVYVCVSTLPAKPYGTKNVKMIGAGLEEIISANMFQPVDITVYGRTPDAMLAADQVILSLVSDYSQRQQALNCFSVGKIPSSVVPLNEIEGASIPYMANVQVNLHYIAYSRRQVEYFNPPFEKQILTNK